MGKLIVFDLDGTLAESEASLDTEMANRLTALLGIVKVAVISGGNWPQFEKQLLSNLAHDERLKNLFLLMVLSKEHPPAFRYRSVDPVLTPEWPQERHGTTANVVLATAIGRRDNLGTPDRFGVYYGMADDRIGVARLIVPEHLPLGAPVGGDGPKVGGQG